MPANWLCNGRNRVPENQTPHRNRTAVDLIRPSTEASLRSEGVDGRVEHGHDEAWLWL
jgi:hypothetical protein